MEKQENAILYGVPKVAYGQDGCTPFPICIRSCGTYLGFAVDYTRAMAESGAAFRLTWDTACWNGGNVDGNLTFDHPAKVFRCGMRAMERNLKLLRRTPETKKEDFMAFIRREIDAGNPVGLGTVPQEGAANITPRPQNAPLSMYPELPVCKLFLCHCSNRIPQSPYFTFQNIYPYRHYFFLILYLQCLIQFSA